MEYPPETGGGGIGSFVKSISGALAAFGHEVHVLSCVPGQVESNFLDNSVHVHRRGQLRIRGIGRLARAPGAASRIRGAVSNWVSYRRIGVNFDVVEAPDWMG